MNISVEEEKLLHAVQQVVPSPVRVESLDGWFEWSEPSAITVGPAAKADTQAAELLAAEVAARGLPALNVVVGETGKVPRIVIGQRDQFPLLEELAQATGDLPADYMGDEGYWLHVSPDRVLVVGETAAGVYYGVQTLVSMLPRSLPARLPAVAIVDRPGLAVRGVMQDFGRGQVPLLSTLKRTVERLGRLKLNTYFLFLEDAYRFESHPEVGAGRDRLEADEVRELIEFARLHHVRIVPIFEALGHMEKLLAQPSFRHLREGDDERGAMVINVAHPETLPLLSDLIGELCDVFIDPLFSVGLDESFGLGTGATKELADRVGRGKLFVGHSKSLREILAARDRRMHMWTDQAEEGFFKGLNLPSPAAQHLADIPRDVVLASWHYGQVDDFDFGELVRDLGFDQLPQGAVDHHGALSPNLLGSAENAYSYMRFAHELGALGGVASCWETEDRNFSFDADWAAIAAFAEALWRPDPRPYPEVLEAFVVSTFGEAGRRLLPGIRLLGDLTAYFEWGQTSLEGPTFTQFYRPFEPAALDDGTVTRLRELSEGLTTALSDVTSALPDMSVSRDLVEVYECGLRQALVLVGMAMARHELATEGKGSGAQVAAELNTWVELYLEQWSHRNRPIGGERTAANLRRVAASFAAGS